jgi:hypothetical protein
MDLEGTGPGHHLLAILLWPWAFFLFSVFTIPEFPEDAPGEYFVEIENLSSRSATLFEADMICFHTYT